MHSLIPFSLPKIPKAFIMYMWVYLFTFTMYSCICALVLLYRCSCNSNCFFFFFFSSLFFVDIFPYISFGSFRYSLRTFSNRMGHCSVVVVMWTALFYCAVQHVWHRKSNEINVSTLNQGKHAGFTRISLSALFGVVCFSWNGKRLNSSTHSSCCTYITFIFSSFWCVPFVLYTVIIPKMDSLKRIDHKKLRSSWK